VELYTLATRDQIFSSTREMLQHLVFFLKRGGLPNLDHELLLELMITGLNAQGFSEKQRWELIQAAEYTGHDIRISPLSQWWPWEVLRRNARTEEDMVKVITGQFAGFLLPFDHGVLNTAANRSVSHPPSFTNHPP
jgi:hypothetical protein